MDRRGAVDEVSGAVESSDAPLPVIGTAPAAEVEVSKGRRIPGRGRHGESARLERLEWLRRQTRASLLDLQTTRLDPDRLRGNIENLVGAVEVPVGIAGPLLVRGEQARGWFYAPLATSEGALVSSVVRGALAISRSGGVVARVHGQQMTRTPVFVLDGLEEASAFSEWIPEQLGAMRRVIAGVSRHARLLQVVPICVGRAVFVRFVYATGDAAGQNMTTTATWRACQWVREQVAAEARIRIRDFVIEANLSGDKKVTFGALASGRGLRVSATALIRGDVLRKVLDTTPEQMARLNRLGMLGSIQSGAVGYTINVANVVAALFTATGQDIACVHESSLGLFDLEPEGEHLRASLVLPSLAVGTVGGGTHLPGQRAALEILGCAGSGGIRKLGELVASFCLALEISTASAVASGAFAAAHERLGRRRPPQLLQRDHLDARFFQSALREASGDQTLVVRGVTWNRLSEGAAILSQLGDDPRDRLVGLHRVRLDVSAGGRESRVSLVVKSKPLDAELLHAMSRMALACGRGLSAAWNEHCRATPFAGSHRRELGVYAQGDERFRRHVPRVYRALRDEAREAFVLVMEDLSDAAVIDAVESTDPWTAARLEATLRGIAQVHAVWLGREEELVRQPWLGPAPTARRMAAMANLWLALAEHAASELPELMDAEALARQRELIATLGEWWPRLERLPRTLVHDDFNPRNIALRLDQSGEHRLKAFDWELATLHVPQYDLAELLAHTLEPDVSRDEVSHYLELHRRALSEAAGRPLDPEPWREGFALALRDFAVNRLAFTFVAHVFREHPYLERVFRTTQRLQALMDHG
jgi:NADP-dependent 3-hydroxy-3-methylglutaryl-CoA reductase